MQVPHIKEIGCGLSVRTGALFIGWIWLIQSLILCSAIVLYDKLYDVHYDYTGEEAFNMDPENYDKKFEPKKTYMVEIENLVTFAVSIVNVVFSQLYLIGIYKRKPNYMKFGLVPFGIVVVVGFFFASLMATNQGISSEVFRQFVCLGIFVYSYIVMYSHYRELKIQKNSSNYNTLLAQNMIPNELITSKDYPIKSSIIINNIEKY